MGHVKDFSLIKLRDEGLIFLRLNRECLIKIKDCNGKLGRTGSRLIRAVITT